MRISDVGGRDRAMQGIEEWAMQGRPGRAVCRARRKPMTAAAVSAFPRVAAGHGQSVAPSAPCGTQQTTHWHPRPTQADWIRDLARTEKPWQSTSAAEL